MQFYGMNKDTHDFGLIGLGVMGRNFILNVVDSGFSASGLDLDNEKVSALEQEASGKQVLSTTKIDDFVASLSTPRVIMMLVPAGKPVDSVIEDLLPHLEQGDIVIDGGNSHFDDTDRRYDYLKEKGYNFMGIGVSGGAKGARLGPSMMPGGDLEVYKRIQPVFEAVAAKVNGEPCVTYLGPKSAGNYVKMVHNGIEYSMMQLISETYDFLKSVGGLNNDDLANVFRQWNNGRLASFLVEITSEIFAKKDDMADGYLVDAILDKAKQKGTGKWTSQHALDLGIPIPAIDISVTMRGLSSQKENRVKAGGTYNGPDTTTMDKTKAIELAEASLYFAFITSYAQGLSLLSAVSEEKSYQLNMADIAKIWRGGCIIRATLLEDIRKAFSGDPQLSNLLLSSYFVGELNSSQASIREMLIAAIGSGVALPGHSTCLAYFDAFRSSRLPTNLIQAQRDHFGSHTYERVDREGVFHTEW